MGPCQHKGPAQLTSDSLLPYLILMVEFPFPLLPALTMASAIYVHPVPSLPSYASWETAFASCSPHHRDPDLSEVLASDH